MRSLAMKLAPGQDLRHVLETLALSHNVSGYVLGVVGNLSRAAFQCPGQSEPNVLEGDLEIITLQGHFSPEGAHLHLSLSDAACQVWGGHLEPGTLVLKGADLLLGLLDQPLPQTPSTLDPNQPTEVEPKPVAPLATPRVEVAVLPGCPWCTRAIRILRSLDIAHALITVDSDETYNALHQRSAMTTFPQVFIDGAVIGGYDALAQLHADGSLDQLR
jgi:predicted DNA-binding protein with PD1-like motif/glutaredoxin